MLRQKEIIVVLLAGIICFGAGCQSQNRFSTHGPEIIQYKGDIGVLRNCCSAAMSLLCEDVKKEKGLDSPPAMKQWAKGWSYKSISSKKSSGSGTSRNSIEKTASRSVLTLGEGGQDWRIDIIWLDDQSATVLIDSPSDDSALVNHLMKLFSNFDVKPVNFI